jgi:hypothetical protein
MIEWIPCELHTHTIHSDGSATLADLVRESERIGVRCIALTDHNTISGHRDIEAVSRSTGMPIIPGLELSTFHGHVLVLGTGSYVDWRTVGRDDLHTAIAAAHRAGGLVGVAHPFRAGKPFCPGCSWEFTVRDWNDIDYLEVWSETFPSIRKPNLWAFALWTELLAQGRRVTAVCGRDWHGGSPGDAPLATTWLGMDGGLSGDVEAAAKDAIVRGRAVCTIGPLLLLSADRTTVTVRIDCEARKGLWHVDAGPLVVRLLGDRGIFHETVHTGGTASLTIDLPREPVRWVRAELHGSVHDVPCMIAFTNPVVPEDVREPRRHGGRNHG